jgi:hypothetical protein
VGGNQKSGVGQTRRGPCERRAKGRPWGKPWRPSGRRSSQPSACSAGRSSRTRVGCGDAAGSAVPCAADPAPNSRADAVRRSTHPARQSQGRAPNFSILRCPALHAFACVPSPLLKSVAHPDQAGLQRLPPRRLAEWLRASLQNAGLRPGYLGSAWARRVGNIEESLTLTAKQLILNTDQNLSTVDRLAVTAPASRIAGPSPCPPPRRGPSS